jgi:hypothetical protein
MHLPIVRIALVTVSALFLVNGIVKFFKREERQTLVKLLSYVAIWGSILTLALFPGASHRISQLLGFGDNLNTLIFFGFAVVFFAIFKLLNAVERLERNISEVVRREALEPLEIELERRAAPPASVPPPPPPAPDEPR